MASPRIEFPYVTIEYCTQCKWMLRAAYFAQELLSTFHLGQVALKPSTGGTFIVEIFHSHDGTDEPTSIQNHVLWDRRIEGGFPEIKVLKRRVRDMIDPARDLGHVDRHTAPSTSSAYDTHSSTSTTKSLLPSSGETITEALIPKPISLSLNSGERQFIPLDIDIKCRSFSRGGDGEGIKENREEARSSGERVAFCNEDCG